MDRKWAARLRPHVRFGISAFLLIAAKRSLRPLVEVGSLIFFDMPLEEDIEGPLPVLRVGAADVPAIGRIFNRPEDELAARLARGDRGYVVIDQGQPVHMRWATFSPTPIPEIGRTLRPGPHESYAYDFATLPNARGKKFSALGRAGMDRELRAEGVTRKLAYVRADNHPMWHALRSAPATRELFRVHYLDFHRPGWPPLVFGKIVPPLY